MKKNKIVIVGGGFAGIACAKKIIQSGGIEANITLVSDNPNFTYYPSLYKLVTTGNQKEVSISLESIFPKDKVHIVHAKMTGLNRSAQEIFIKDRIGNTNIFYDYLVLALGSEAHYFNLPNLEKDSFSFKSVDESLKLRAHFETILSQAKNMTHEELLAKLHIVIIGAGPSGVELAGTLKPYLVTRAKAHGIDPSFITIDLVDAASRVLSKLDPKLSEIAEKRLRTLGVNIFTNRALKYGDDDEIVLNDMEINTHTIIWTAGTKINNLYPSLQGVNIVENRVEVTQHMTMPDNNHIFIIGDGAQTKYSGLAQTAIYDGEYAGYAISNSIKMKPFKGYVPKKPGFIIPIGKNWAIISYKGIVLSGFIPSLIRKFVDFRYKFFHLRK